MNKRNYFSSKKFTVNRAKRKLGKARTHAELIARMRVPVIAPKVVRERLQCEWMDWKNDRCKSDAALFVLRESVKPIKLCQSHYRDGDKVMGIIDKLGRISKGDRIPDDNPNKVKTVKVKAKTDISRVVEDRSDYFLSESELEVIKSKILENENE